MISRRSSCGTNNSSQAPFDGVTPPLTSAELTKMASQGQGRPPVSNSISPDLIALITQTVQAAVAAEQANVVQLTLSSSSSIGAVGGIPSSSSLPSLLIPAIPSMANSVAAQSLAGKPVFSSVVPSFLLTFAAPAMSVGSLHLTLAVSSVGAECNLGEVKPETMLVSGLSHGHRAAFQGSL